jgi:hypothetical protein
MDHFLDSPAWHALNTHNKQVSFGNEKARYFDREVSPFAEGGSPMKISGCFMIPSTMTARSCS